MRNPFTFGMLAIGVALAACGTAVAPDPTADVVGATQSTQSSASTLSSTSTLPTTSTLPSTSPSTSTLPTSTSVAPRAVGVVAVSLEEVSGFFIEGFEIGLRFETTDGHVIAATLWSDFVQSQASQDIDAFYTSVLEQEVPAGEVVVLATVNVGMGPGPVVPDLDGDLKCRLKVEVPEGGRVDVEVSFSGSDDCLRRL